MASLRDLIDNTAELDEDENDDSFDEETGDVRSRKNKPRKDFDLDDSSEEEEDDDDEEANRKVWLPSCPIPIAS